MFYIHPKTCLEGIFKDKKNFRHLQSVWFLACDIATTARSDLDILKWLSDAINQFINQFPYPETSRVSGQRRPMHESINCVFICCYYTKWLRIKREKMPLSTVDRERFKEHKLFNSKNQPWIVTLLCTMNYLCMQSINYFLYCSQV